MWGLEESGFSPELESGSGAFSNATTLVLEGNFTLSCAARSIQGPVHQPYPVTIVTIVRICQSIVLFFTSFSGMFLNAILVVLISKFKKLHTLSFGIAIQLAALGIMISIVYFLCMIHSIANRWLLGEHMCRFIGAMVFTAAIVRTLLLVVFVIDRFLSVFMPYAYPKHQKKVVIFLSFTAWCASLVGMVPGYVLDCAEFSSNHWYCFYNPGCSGSCSVLFTLVYTLLLAPSYIIPLFLYLSLFIKAKKAKKAMAIDDANKGKNTYDWKATITFFLLFLTTCALTSPVGIIRLIIALTYRGEHPPLSLYMLSVIATSLVFFLPVTDAIVILRNRDVADILKEQKKRYFKKCRIGKDLLHG